MPFLQQNQEDYGKKWQHSPSSLDDNDDDSCQKSSQGECSKTQKMLSRDVFDSLFVMGTLCRLISIDFYLRAISTIQLLMGLSFSSKCFTDTKCCSLKQLTSS